MSAGSRTPAPADHAAGITRARLITFGLVTLLCIAGAIGYGWHAATRTQASAAAAPRLQIEPIAVLPAGDRPYLVYGSTAIGESYGRVAISYPDAPDGPRLLTPLRCERVHVSSGTGVCLEARRGAITTYTAHLFDRDFRIRHSHPLAGPPSRARVSPDGRLAAVTVFVTGHSYASTGFVTRTSIIDAGSGQMLIDDLEKIEVERDGKVVKAVDFNFWGVTFTRDGTRYYATLGTGGETLLIEGDVAARRARVLRGDVECPSLSPDNTRIAFKRRQPDGPGRFRWGIVVLELATGRETALIAEQRNVDDQVEWLGNETLLYAMPQEGGGIASAATDVWGIAADGSGSPQKLMGYAQSPASVRP
jgi:hypothetical protein